MAVCILCLGYTSTDLGGWIFYFNSLNIVVVGRVWFCFFCVLPFSLNEKNKPLPPFVPFATLSAKIPCRTTQKPTALHCLTCCCTYTKLHTISATQIFSFVKYSFAPPLRPPLYACVFHCSNGPPLYIHSFPRGFIFWEIFLLKIFNNLDLS